MKDELVRFGIAMEGTLLEALDAVVAKRGGTRSEVLRDLARGEVMRAKIEKGTDAVGTLTIVYDHHVRELGARLTELQHELGEQVRANTHVHLDHNRCLEVIILAGRADRLQEVADRIIATRGVIHGGLELFTDVPHKPTWRRESGAADDRAHRHAHAHGHVHPPAKRTKRKRAR